VGVPSSDEELIKEALRAVLGSENVSGKALEAKAAAARQLAKLNGLAVADESSGGAEGELPPDPMADLFLIERARQLKLARLMSASEFLAFQGRALDADPATLAALERRIVALESRSPKLAARARRRG